MEPASPSFRLVVRNFLLIIAAVLFGMLAMYGYHAFHLATPPVELRAEIVGPDRIEFAGQLALFRASVPGKSPGKLIHTWDVESLDGAAKFYPELLPTSNAGEIQCTTVAGRWRLWCAVTDPASRCGQMLSREVFIPRQAPNPIPPKPVPPEPSPPAPNPAPAPTPAPAPSPTPPAPANRFSDLTADVRAWLLDVSSPNKSAELAAMRAGAMAIVERLQTGDLSKSSGMSLELSVIRAVQQSNSDAIKGNAAAWKGFAGKVGTYAGTALSAKKLVAPADWAELLHAFADGLQ